MCKRFGTSDASRFGAADWTCMATVTRIWPTFPKYSKTGSARSSRLMWPVWRAAKCVAVFDALELVPGLTMEDHVASVLHRTARERFEAADSGKIPEEARKAAADARRIAQAEAEGRHAGLQVAFQELMEHFEREREAADAKARRLVEVVQASLGPQGHGPSMTARWGNA